MSLERPSRRYWSAQDVASYLGRSTKWVYARAAAGDIPSIRLSPQSIAFDPVDLDLWIDRKKQGVGNGGDE
jgi:predicted DNA-binding transcriptional regulator AlpA